MTKWISIKNELPEVGKQVLTYCSDYPKMPIKVNYLHDYEETWTYDSLRKITHWMPLPEPPEQI